MKPHELLIAAMKKAGIDQYIVPTSDAHQMEYLDQHDRTREFLSGFTGSSGTLVVTKNGAYLWTDGRYFLQAEKELEGSGIELMKMGEEGVPTVEEFVRARGGVIGFDAKTFPLRLYERLEGMERIDIDLVTPLWVDRPSAHRTDAFLVKDGNFKRTAKEKLYALREDLKGTEASATIIGALEDICWILNIRARDVRCNPVFTSYLFVDMERSVLFASEEHITEEVCHAMEEADVKCMPYDAVFDFMDNVTETVYLDPDRSSTRMRMHIHGEVVTGRNLTAQPKAIKDESEISAIRRAMHEDGIALVRFLNWLEHNKAKGITEMDVVDTLLQYRAKGKSFVEESFETIAGYGANGAIIHYQPTKQSHAKIEPKGLLLLDSGGQYFGGTTDITRTIPMGELTEDEKRDYTLVLKSHIALATVIFPRDTRGYALDAITRAPLWELCKDYKHGTGHGVGFFLGVHEGPQSISRGFIDVPMECGMVTSNEPGLYIPGKHGIRIESLVLTVPYEKNAFGEFYAFETLTLCPIDTRPILPELLSEKEKAWVEDYNRRVFEELSNELTAEECETFKAITKL